MARAARTCSTCPRVIRTGSRCASCQRQADLARGTSTDRGYGSEHRQRFRSAVLERDPICVLCRSAWSTVADHWPVSRRELVLRQLDPNDPDHGRGLCKSCHDSETAHAQPGGWHAEG